MEKICYTMGEAAEILSENTSLVRYWSNTFPRFIHPTRNAKGNRMFSKDDIETLKHIHYLVNVEGMTLEGVARTLAEEKKGKTRETRLLESLKMMRSQLVEIKNMI